MPRTKGISARRAVVINWNINVQRVAMHSGIGLTASANVILGMMAREMHRSVLQAADKMRRTSEYAARVPSMPVYQQKKQQLRSRISCGPETVDSALRTVTMHFPPVLVRQMMDASNNAMRAYDKSHVKSDGAEASHKKKKKKRVPSTVPEEEEEKEAEDEQQEEEAIHPWAPERSIL